MDIIILHKNMMYSFYLSLLKLLEDKLPVASYFTSVISGLILGALFGVGEAIKGQTRVILGLAGTFWFVFSTIVFVQGARAFDWHLGKDTRWNVSCHNIKRGFSYVLSMAFAYVSVFFIINGKMP